MNRTRAIVAVCTLFAIAALSGCGGAAPYGSIVLRGGVESASVLNLNDEIKVESGVNVARDRELLPVYVQSTEIEDGALDRLENFDRHSFDSLVVRSTKEAMAGFGRFTAVNSEHEAMLLAEARVISAIPWQDTVTSDDGFKIKGQDRRILGGEKKELEREGIDLVMSLTFKRLDGAFIANSYVTGRLSSERGTVIREFEADYEQNSGEFKDFQELNQAALDERRLGSLVLGASRGLVLVVVEQGDYQWWLNEINASGMRPVNVAFVMDDED